MFDKNQWIITNNWFLANTIFGVWCVCLCVFFFAGLLRLYGRNYVLRRNKNIVKWETACRCRRRPRRSRCYLCRHQSNQSHNYYNARKWFNCAYSVISYTLHTDGLPEHFAHFARSCCLLLSWVLIHAQTENISIFVLSLPLPFSQSTSAFFFSSPKFTRRNNKIAKLKLIRLNSIHGSKHFSWFLSKCEKNLCVFFFKFFSFLSKLFVVCVGARDDRCTGGTHEKTQNSILTFCGIDISRRCCSMPSIRRFTYNFHSL